MKKSYRNKVLAAFLCLCLVVVFVFSSVYLAEHAGHDCAGAHCEICYHLHSADNLLRQIGAAVIAAAPLFIVLSLLFRAVTPNADTSAGTNLVALKVKLNN
jgi:hypothetical protein